jgi:D-glycero-alpha-D-manno-heptose-7-phosphate kinase
MIISRTPLRISLGGGGTDLESYFKKNNGFVVSAAINKYIMVVIKENLKKNFEIKYSEYEKVNNVNKIKHNIIRECLKKFNITNGIEVSSFSDVPSGTGLGSSGAFTVCLLNALYAFKKKKISKRKLVFEAYNIEKNILKLPTGYQDQAIASYGGVLVQKYFKKNIQFSKIKVNKIFNKNFENNLLLIFTGFQRESKNILRRQINKTNIKNYKMIENLNYIKQLGKETYANIKKNNLNNYGRLIKKHWEYKKNRDGEMTNKKINEIINICNSCGAQGSKVVGAGGGGYILTYANNLSKIKKELSKRKFVSFNIKISNEGSKIIKV